MRQDDQDARDARAESAARQKRQAMKPMADARKQADAVKRRAEVRARRQDIESKIVSLEMERQQIARNGADGSEIQQRLYTEIEAGANAFEGTMRGLMHSNRLTGLMLGERGALCYYFGDLLKIGVDNLASSQHGVAHGDRVSRLGHIATELLALRRELDTIA